MALSAQGLPSGMQREEEPCRQSLCSSQCRPLRHAGVQALLWRLSSGKASRELEKQPYVTLFPWSL